MLIVFTFVFGLRYDVGVDYLSYADEYNNPAHRDENVEFLFKWVSDALKYLDMPQWAFFSIWVFFQFLFLLLAFKDKRFLLPSLMIVFIFGQYFLLWMNGIRQDLATCIFIFSIKYIVEKKPLKYILCIILAYGIHHTAIALLFFYPLFRLRKDYTKQIKIYIQILILVACAYIYATNTNIYGDIDDLLAIYLGGTEYDKYAYGVVSNTTVESKLGISFLSFFTVDVLLVLYSNKLKKYYASDFFNISYNLYYIGAVLGLLLGNSIILLRGVRYFRYFKMIVVAFLFYYLFKKFRSNIVSVLSLLILVVMYLLQFAALFFYAAEQKMNYHFIFFQ